MSPAYNGVHPDTKRIRADGLAGFTVRFSKTDSTQMPIYRLIMKLKWERYLKKLQAKGLVIGSGSQILEPCFLDPAHCFLIHIGENCTLAPGIRILAHDASTKRHLGYTKIGRVSIADNCFIGSSSIILPGVSIGKNSIIGAGSIVTRDIPSNSVAAGNPIKIICSTQSYIKKMNLLMQHSPCYDDSYLIGSLTSEMKKKMISDLSSGIGFIV